MLFYWIYPTDVRSRKSQKDVHLRISDDDLFYSWTLADSYIQNRRYWETTESGAYIVPSRTSILETLPKIVNQPAKLTPKSTIGTFENIIFQIRNFGTYHPFATFAILIVAVIALLTIVRNGMKNGFTRSGSGFFRLDGKDGLLGNPNTAKAD